MAKAPASSAPTETEELLNEGTNTTGAPKNFRSIPDIENFFRFIHENDLREEGAEILNAVVLKKAEKRAAKKAAN